MTTEVLALEKQLKDAKFLIARRDAALKLHSNREFKQLIIDDFCGTECARFAQMSADPALGPVERADALAMAQASGHLKRYLSVITQMGNVSEGSIVSIEEALDEVRGETE